jgi:glycosyltransferase involved in cell wall biosynthesis
MNYEPLISVVLTTRNRSSVVSSAILSVLGQTYKNVELHIVDDASSDDTEQVILEFSKKHENVFYWRHEGQEGLPVSRNTGLEQANGDYVAFIDDDDEWAASKLTKQMSQVFNMSDPKIVYYCGQKVLDKDGNITSINYPTIRGKIKKYIITPGLKTIPSSSLLNVKIYRSIGGFDTDLKTGIDHDMWMKLAKHGYSAEYLNDPLVISRTFSNQMTKDVDVRIQGIKAYLHKWKPSLVEWYGRKSADKYITKYYLRVIGELGYSMLLSGNKSAGKKCLLEAYLFHKPTFILSKYAIMHIFGVKIYLLIAKLVSEFKKVFSSIFR